MSRESSPWSLGFFSGNFTLNAYCLLAGLVLRLARRMSRPRDGALKKLRRLTRRPIQHDVDCHLTVEEFALGLGEPMIKINFRVKHKVASAYWCPSLLSLKSKCLELRAAFGDDTESVFTASVPLSSFLDSKDAWVYAKLSDGKVMASVVPSCVEHSDYNLWMEKESAAIQRDEIAYRCSSEPLLVLWLYWENKNDILTKELEHLAESLPNNSRIVLCLPEGSNLGRPIKVKSEIEIFECNNISNALQIFNNSIFSSEYKLGVLMQGLVTLRLFTPREFIMEWERNSDTALFYSDHDFIVSDHRMFPQFKPGFGIETLESVSFLGPVVAVNLDILRQLNEAIDHDSGLCLIDDLAFRFAEKNLIIRRIAKILYHQKPDSGSGSIPNHTQRIAVLNKHFERTSLTSRISPGLLPNTTSVMTFIPNKNAKVSILIPNKDAFVDLKTCVDSILQKTTWLNYEIVIIENNSTQKEIFDYYSKLENHPKVRVLRWPDGFNYAAINNFAANETSSEYLLFLNNDMELISSDWLEKLISIGQKERVGAVGAKLYYPDGQIQHGGVVLGILGVAAHVHGGAERDASGYLGRLKYTQNVSCVTAACLLMRREVFQKVGGFDEGFAVAFNDVDLCCKIISSGYRIVWTPEVELYHFESKSRGAEDSPVKKERFAGEVSRFQHRWKDLLAKGDDFYNPNLSLRTHNCSLELGASRPF